MLYQLRHLCIDELSLRPEIRLQNVEVQLRYHSLLAKILNTKQMKR